MKNLWAICLCLAGALFPSLEIRAATGPHPALLPQPARVEWRAGNFRVGAQTSIAAGAFADAARFLAEALKIPTRGGDATIRFLQVRGLPAEGYELEVAATGVVLRASSPAGAFYGVQTLLQLRTGENGALAAATIRDEPRFAWRGLMLDCSRTFQSVDYLHRTIDRLAAFKMNVLHLHLTDDQGWRMEIKKYPMLTAKGARFSPRYSEPEAHQGYYTQAELKELVGYAAARGITIVPEIEMPGHSQEVLVCRPDLSCTGKIPDNIFPYGKGAGITPDILCAGNDDTLRFLQDVLDEVMEIFPSRFIHLGGDEAPKGRWKACPKCQARIKAEGLKDEAELQNWLTRRMAKYLAGKGRRLIGWDDIAEGALADDAAVMWWRAKPGQRGLEIVKHAMQQGHEAVMSPNTCCYFDYPSTRINPERVYGFDPVAGLTPEQAKLVLGLQACFWSHLDREPGLVDRQLFPRLLALAERGWSPASVQDWPAFKQRLDAQSPRLREMGVHFQTDEPAGR